VLVWLAPVIATSGGLGAWSERSLDLFAPSGDRARQFISNTAITAIILAVSVGPAAAISLASNPRQTGEVLRSAPGRFLLLWTLPALVLLWLVDSTEAGHALVFIGALCALAGGLLSQVKRTWVATALVVLFQTAIFLLAAPRPDKPPPWAPNAALMNLTQPGIQRQQASLDDTLRAIQRFDATDTVVLSIGGQNAYRFLMYYLPSYAVLDVDEPAHTVLAAKGRQQGHWQEWSDCPFDPTGVRHALLVVWTNSEPGLVPYGATPIAGGGDGPFQTWELNAANRYACR
jgi:hypothetical protein